MSIGHLISVHILRSTAESILEALTNDKQLELTTFDLNELHTAIEEAIIEDDA